MSASKHVRRVGLAALAATLSAATFAAFTNPFTPAYRGAPLTHYAYWESFTIGTGGPNTPTDPASNAPASIEQLTPGGFVTGGGNLYHFTGIPEFVLTSSTPAAALRVSLQVSTWGAELDYGATRLEYVDSFGVTKLVAPSTHAELARYVAMGVNVESLFEWDLATLGDEVEAFQLRFVGAETNLSLDAVAFDVQFEQPVETYCTAKVTSQGCTPQLSWSGEPSLAASAPFTITATGVNPGAATQLFYGLSGPAATPYRGGLVCVAPALRRTPVQFASSASNCGAQASFDFNAWSASGVDPQLQAGATVHAQFWGRDSADPYGASFSDGIVFELEP